MKPEIYHADYSVFLDPLKINNVDLILTDPPYAISKDTGFKNMKNFVKKFSVSMDFGDWDQPIDLTNFCTKCYACLRRGGTLIVWYDLWKITDLRESLVHAGFKMLRLIVWQKSNPVPLNQSVTYLSNSREIAIVAVKGGKPTFNSKYDSGMYHLQNNIHPRLHPTQKPLILFSELVLKHTNHGDLVVDPFVGSGTTAVASIQNGRCFKGCDIEEQFCKIARERLSKTQLSIESC